MSEQKTIFEGLYQIDWSAGGVYSSRSGLNAIPDAIRDLMSHDENIRQSTRGFLFGEGAQEYGMIVNTTPYVAQFVFELISLEETPERDRLLCWFVSMLDERRAKSYNSIRDMRNYMAVCDLAEQQLPLIVKLLKHYDSEVRYQASALLGKLNNSLDHVVHELIAQFPLETSQDVQVSILKALADLFDIYNHRSIDLRNQSGPFFREIVENHLSHEVRYAAAWAGVVVATSTMFRQTKQDEISLRTSSIFVDEFWQRYEEDGEGYTIENVLLKLTLLPDCVEKLWQLINDERLSDETRHTVLRSLIFAKFSPSYYRTIGPRIKDADNGYFYHHFYTQYRNLSEDTLIKAIVDDDLLWQKPTNLFSYFLGLPDSRDELRAFLESDKD